MDRSSACPFATKHYRQCSALRATRPQCEPMSPSTSSTWGRAKRTGRSGLRRAVARRERRGPRAAGEDAADVLDGSMRVMATREPDARDGVYVCVLQPPIGCDALKNRPAGRACDTRRLLDHECHPRRLPRMPRAQVVARRQRRQGDVSELLLALQRDDVARRGGRPGWWRQMPRMSPHESGYVRAVRSIN